jgi:SAM-dependent methyltransferase
MKLRDSGMPSQDYWETLLDVPLILDRFGIGQALRDVAELGCGYGTFTLPVAKRVVGIVHAFDIDPQMTELTGRRAAEAGLSNVNTVMRDVLEQGFGLQEASVDAVLLFNILHCERPADILREAARVARAGGIVAVVHWRTDIATPRGPSAEIRPDAARIATWAGETNELDVDGASFDLPPWHYGLKLLRRQR